MSCILYYTRDIRVIVISRKQLLECSLEYWGDKTVMVKRIEFYFPAAVHVKFPRHSNLSCLK